ncbi:MAG: AAA family ATPase [Candidatus Dadabacteria bacterium]|nr:AAA family ATPase [Candidatus Dadabacteria bacterium]
MKISKLRLENIKCFQDVELSFEENEGDIKDWSLIVGDNGRGKTTILRSLATGLCDKEGVSALLAELHGGFLRQGANKGSIEICLKDEDNKKYTIKTKIEGESESISQDVFLGDCVGKKETNRARNFKRENIFAVAYGAGRSVEGDRSYEEYALVDSVYTLFKYEHPLQNAELGARRVNDHKKKQWKRLQEILKEVLMLEKDDEISLEITGLYIKTKRGKYLFQTLSDGYKSLTSVIIDFVSWNLLYELDFDLSSLSGIFIIDELEQHLHPRWQREIVKILSKQFPNVQFICSTHTPICALGLSDLERSWLFKAAYVNNHSGVERFNLQEEFKGYRADQILTSDIFGLPDTRSVSVQDKLETYKKIYLKEENKRSPEEKQQFRDIEGELKDLPMWDNKKEKEKREKLIKLLENLEKKS